MLVKKSSLIIMGLLLCVLFCGCGKSSSLENKAISEFYQYNIPEGWEMEEMDSPSEVAIWKDESYISLFLEERKNADKWHDKTEMVQSFERGQFEKGETLDDITYEYIETEGDGKGIIEETFHIGKDTVTNWATYGELYNGEKCLVIVTRTNDKKIRKEIKIFVDSITVKQKQTDK